MGERHKWLEKKRLTGMHENKHASANPTCAQVENVAIPMMILLKRGLEAPAVSRR